MDETFRRLLEQHRLLESLANPLHGVAFPGVSAAALAGEAMRLQEVQRIKEEIDRQELLERQVKLANFGGALGLQADWLSAHTNVPSAVDRIAQEAMEAARHWQSLNEPVPYHLREAVALLQAADPVALRFGAVRAPALLAVALEESLGLSATLEVTRQARVMEQLVQEAEARNGQLKWLSEAAQIKKLAARVVESDHLASYAFGDAAGVASLARRMQEMARPWPSAMDSLGAATAFAHVLAIGDIVATAPPFAASVGSWLRADLGDWRDELTFEPQLSAAPARQAFYTERGVSESITSARPRVLLQTAGIACLFEEDEDWANVWVGASDDELALSEMAYARMLRFELALRAFIASRMAAICGVRWTRGRLPNGMLDGWKERQEKARAGGEEVSAELIAYADFTDYIRIIERTDNWREVFEPVFGRKEDIRESLQRLHMLRLPTAHARPLHPADLLLMLCETKRVVRAFGQVAVTITGAQLPH